MHLFHLLCCMSSYCYHRKQSLGIYRNHLDRVSICLFVHPSVSVCNRVWSVIIFLIEKHCKFLLDAKIANDLTVYHDHDPKSFGQSSKSMEGRVHNLCMGYTFLIENHWTFLLHTKIACVLKVSHDLDPKSFGQVQGH